MIEPSPELLEALRIAKTLQRQARERAQLLAQLRDSDLTEEQGREALRALARDLRGQAHAAAHQLKSIAQPPSGAQHVRTTRAA